MRAYSLFMMQDPEYFFSSQFHIFGVVLFLAVVLEVALKGVALWRAARMKKTGWFVALLIINTVGILPFIFLFLTKKEYEHQQKGEKLI